MDGRLVNDAPQGAQIRVVVTYRHRLVTGRLFSRLADDPESNTINLRATLVARRE